MYKQINKYFQAYMMRYAMFDAMHNLGYVHI